jgi:hypothetical protein
MGLLDRFKKEPGPDALTWEAVARVRAMPGVAGAEAVDADTVAVTWAEHPGTSTLSLAGVREQWTKASGFARIELMDEALTGLAPPAVEPPIAPASSPIDPDDDDGGAAWAAARPRLRVIVGRAGDDAAVVAWPVAPGLVARAVLGGPGALPVDAGDVAGWGVSADDVRAAALDDLMGGDPALDAVGPGQPGWVPTSPADHPPAWLAAPDRLLAASGLTEAVALAPMATELVIVDPSAHDLLRSVLIGTKSILAGESRVLCARALLLTAHGVTAWEPAPDHPCAAAAADLAAG